MNKCVVVCLCAVSIGAFQRSAGAVEAPRIADEYESTGDHALGMSNGGSAALAGASAIRMNPALLALEKTYSVAGGYHWPAEGREFYQAGVVDSKTSSVAAGVIATGFMDLADSQLASEYQIDSPINRRVVVGIGKTLQNLSLGVNVQYVEAHYPSAEVAADPNLLERRRTGTTLGVGVAGLFTQNLRFGLSAENLANDRVRRFSPRFFRAGLAYLTSDGKVTIHGDYINRQRVPGVEYNVVMDQQTLTGSENPREVPGQTQEPEQLLIGSFSVRMYDLMRLLAGYGHSVDGKRQTLSGGLALVNGPFSISYLASRPYLNSDVSHQAVNIGVQLAM